MVTLPLFDVAVNPPAIWAKVTVTLAFVEIIAVPYAVRFE